MDGYRNLYAKYGKDLEKVKLRASPCALKGLSSDMELELAYLRIRHSRPNMVSAVPTAICCYSALHLNAL